MTSFSLTSSSSLSSFPLMGGQSINNPPLFNGSNYSYWKSRMSIWIQGHDWDLWDITCNGPKIPMKTPINVTDGASKAIAKEPKEFDEKDKKMMQLNSKAISILYCALEPNEFNRISACTSAKEIWDKLKVAHEGTDEVRENKLNILVHDYELFKMHPYEDIKSMFTRFTTITNELALYGRSLGDQ